MGIGFWAMHFKGMLAFRLPVQVSCTVVLSLLVAILASVFALYEVSRQELGLARAANFCRRQLASATPNSGKLREAISEIVNDGARASAVISKIRGLLQKSAPERTAVDVNQIIEEVTILLRNEMTRHRVSLRADLAADLPRVSGDPVQLQQVLINLVMNGIDAMRSLARRPRELLSSQPETTMRCPFKFKTLEPGSIQSERSTSSSHSLPLSQKVSEWDYQSAGL